MGIRRKGQAVGGMVILAKPKRFDMGGLNHHGAGGGGERSAGEGTGKGVAGKNLVPETGRAAGLSRGLGLFRAAGPVVQNFSRWEAQGLGQRQLLKGGKVGGNENQPGRSAKGRVLESSPEFGVEDG